MLNKFFTNNVLALVMLFCFSSYAFADNMKNAKSNNNQNDLEVSKVYSIDKLPNEGLAKIEGMVSSIEDTRHFTLKDKNNETIKVETSSPVSLMVNDLVIVNGTVDSYIAGLGKSIESARVHNKIINENPNMAATKSKTHQDVSQIDNLPEHGHVSIEGTVKSITFNETANSRFILQDKTGEIIDVHANEKLNIQKGDEVKVEGYVKDEIKGTSLGEEIIATQIIVMNQNS